MLGVQLLRGCQRIQQTVSHKQRYSRSSSSSSSQRVLNTQCFYRTFSSSENEKQRTFRDLSSSEFARNLVESRKSGVFTTVSIEPEKHEMPLFGSIMPYVMKPEGHGNPIFAIRQSEQHYQHLQSLNRVSFLVYPLTPLQIPPSQIPLPKVNFIGHTVPIENLNFLQNEGEIEEARSYFLEKHPGASELIKDDDFKFFSLKPTDIYYIGAKSKEATELVDVGEYSTAKLDPIALAGLQIIPRINKKYSPVLPLLCQEYGGTEVSTSSAFLFFVDRFGFNVFGIEKASNHWVNFRVPFERELEGPMDCVTAIEASLDELVEERRNA